MLLFLRVDVFLLVVAVFDVAVCCLVAHVVVSICFLVVLLLLLVVVFCVKCCFLYLC